MATRVLVTGGAGFVGQWLTRELVRQGWSVFAGSIDGPPSTGVLTDAERKAICWIELDVTSDQSIERALDRAAPDFVVHLAGIAFTPDANADPSKAFDVNALGALRLLRRLSAKTRVLVVGSAEQYGAHPRDEYPLKETAAVQPLTTYAASKAAQELIALQMHRSTGVPVICTRSFNHSGVGHDGRYFLPRQVARARQLRPGEKLRMGNNTIRDYLHVADVVDAYILLLEKGLPGEVYNVSSGSGVAVRDIAARLLKRMGIMAEIGSDPELVRATDIPISIGDNTKLRQATGWAPKRSIDDIIDDLIHAAPR